MGKAESRPDSLPKPKATFFTSPAALRTWFEKHHATKEELWVGYYKRDSGKPSVTWSESVDVALCFGWIDGVRKSLGDSSYTNRFTPRRPGSKWSAVNIRRVRELQKQGLMRPAGVRAFQGADEAKAAYSYEQRKTAELSAAFERTFRANRKAWDFFQAQAPWYRRTAAFWVVSAKKDETKLKRLTSLIEYSQRRQTIPPLTRPAKANH